MFFIIFSNLFTLFIYLFIIFVLKLTLVVPVMFSLLAWLILGETSAGKTTLINKILQKKIFKRRNVESTSTICKIRNSERVRIITESSTGQIEETDLTDRCDLATSKGVKVLRDYLKDLTDMTSSKRSKDYFRSVDIGFPISFLMVKQFNRLTKIRSCKISIFTNYLSIYVYLFIEIFTFKSINIE